MSAWERTMQSYGIDAPPIGDPVTVLYRESARPKIHAEAHRRLRNYSLQVYVLRILWAAFYPAFRFSPRLFYGWRNLLLRLFGARIGRKVRVYPGTSIVFPWNLTVGDYSTLADGCTLYCLGHVKIGKNVMLSQGTHVCAGTHDYRRADLPLLTPPVVIEDCVWCCADSFVGPGVTLEVGCIVGARAVVMHDVDRSNIVAGNPAQVVGMR